MRNFKNLVFTLGMCSFVSGCVVIKEQPTTDKAPVEQKSLQVNHSHGIDFSNLDLSDAATFEEEETEDTAEVSESAKENATESATESAEMVESSPSIQFSIDDFPFLKQHPQKVVEIENIERSLFITTGFHLKGPLVATYTGAENYIPSSVQALIEQHDISVSKVVELIIEGDKQWHVINDDYQHLNPGDRVSFDVMAVAKPEWGTGVMILELHQP
ncbi:hypothetical protein [Pleionea sp. CnH1-48]|uniref:hypothetical protein n=1 Tax=Pleionea sp. CnH1-48 TaxID=2954494 RepID=UPI0020982AC6|nr:hypothetical protein [Pleionea sp. CnH1-48]MCO7223412.1 hypothetical protein [Pleionea sp. CnH1-48]